jgi:hypothetical protein
VARLDVVLDNGDTIKRSRYLIDVLLLDEVKEGWATSQARTQADMHSMMLVQVEVELLHVHGLR